MTVSYCVHCRRKTEDVNPRMVQAKNGRAMRKSKCGSCGHSKSCFVSSRSGSGVRHMNISGSKALAGSGVRRRRKTTTRRRGGSLIDSIGNIAGAATKFLPFFL